LIRKILERGKFLKGEMKNHNRDEENNRRNGKISKTLYEQISDHSSGKLSRDRAGSFEPETVNGKQAHILNSKQRT